MAQLHLPNRHTRPVPARGFAVLPARVGIPRVRVKAVKSF